MDGAVRIRTPSVAVTMAIWPALNVTVGGAVLAVEVGLGVGSGVGSSVAVGVRAAGDEDGGLAGGSGIAVGAWVVAVTGDAVAAGELEPLPGVGEGVGLVPAVQPASTTASTRPVSLVRPVIVNASAPGRRG